MGADALGSPVVMPGQGTGPYVPRATAAQQGSYAAPAWSSPASRSQQMGLGGFAGFTNSNWPLILTAAVSGLIIAKVIWR